MFVLPKSARGRQSSQANDIVGAAAQRHSIGTQRPEDSLLEFQRAVGNQAVVRILGRVLTFSDVGPATDSPRVQPKAACGCGGRCPSCREHDEGATREMQAKLTLNRPGDPSEAAANRMAG